MQYIEKGKITMIMELRFNDGYVLETEPYFHGNLVDIKDEPINKSGFKVYNKGVMIYDASAFVTVYDEEETYYTLSNDGSVKPEPIPPTPIEPTYTEVRLTSDGFDLVCNVIDLSYSGDVSFYIQKEMTEEDFLESLESITIDDETIDLTDGYTFQTCESSELYEKDLYYVVYHKYTEQELINQQVEINMANIDFIAMESDIEL